MRDSHQTIITNNSPLFAMHQDLVKECGVELALFVVITAFLPSVFAVFFSVFLFGSLYLNCDRLFKGDAIPETKLSFKTLAMQYPQALALTACVWGLCLFALVGLSLPFGLLPKSWFSTIFSWGPFDLTLILVFLGLFIATTVYLSYSFLFFWVEKAGILDSLQRSYQLVRGQWWRTALYATLGNILPLVIFAAVLMLYAGLIGKIFGITSKEALAGHVSKLIWVSFMAWFVFPQQTIWNYRFFQKLRAKKSPASAGPF